MCNSTPTLSNLHIECDSESEPDIFFLNRKWKSYDNNYVFSQKFGLVTDHPMFHDNELKKDSRGSLTMHVISK